MCGKGHACLIQLITLNYELHRLLLAERIFEVGISHANVFSIFSSVSVVFFLVKSNPRLHFRDGAFHGAVGAFAGRQPGGMEPGVLHGSP